MRFLSSSMTISPLPAMFSSLCDDCRLAHDQHQLALKMTAFTDAMRLRRISQAVAANGRRPDRAGIEQFDHALEMSTVARDPRAQHPDVVARRPKAGGRWSNP